MDEREPFIFGVKVLQLNSFEQRQKALSFQKLLTILCKPNASLICEQYPTA